MRPICGLSFVTLCGLFVYLGMSAAGQDPPKKKVQLGDNVVLEIDGKQKRVLINTYVCLRQGQLEQLVTRKRTKEHEAILAVDTDARNIHLALVAAGAEPGSPVKFRPKFEAPKGDEITVTLEYKEKGKTVRVPAQQWIRNIKSKKDLETNWVFAGSVLIPDPLDPKKPRYYGANDGDVICISNFDTAMLDVPFNSPKDNDDLAFEAHTDRIPPLETPVLVILELVPKKK
jgi:hypothetical protein